MNNNAILPYAAASLKELQESLGVAQYSGEYGWTITISGFLHQGNRIIIPASGSVPVSFIKGYPKLCLGIQPGDCVSAVTNTGFTLTNNTTIDREIHWWAIGL